MLALWVYEVSQATVHVIDRLIIFSGCAINKYKKRNKYRKLSTLGATSKQRGAFVFVKTAY